MKCFECGDTADHQHHVVPKSRGGTKTIPLCVSCHSKVHGKKMAHSTLTKLALSNKKNKGEVYSTVPFGYSIIAGKLVAVESETIIIKEVVRRRLAGNTLQSIADELNSIGIVGKKGGKWFAGSVSYLINRQAA